MNNDATISILNDLIETSKDGEKGFAKAAEDTKSAQLKAIFMQASSRCAASARELQEQVRALGGEPEDGGSALGAMHRGWLDVKLAVTGRDDKAILSECERGEDVAKASYAKALRENLPANVRAIVERQNTGVLANHDRVLALRNAAT
ncbi:MAG: PA2169 family four-helix-bundle protein [Pseudomonadota bacterium]